MKAYSGCCPYCGHIWKGMSRRATWDYFMKHCKDTKNHPTVEPYLARVTDAEYWLWKFNPDQGRLEQIERHALTDIIPIIRNIPPH